MEGTLSTSAWLDEFFASYYRHRPVSATFIGMHAHDGQLPDYSSSGVAAQLAETRALLDQVDTGAVAPPATDWEALDRLLARNFLLTQVWELTDTRVLLENPCLYTGEATFGIVSLLLRDFKPLEERVESAVQRLRALPELLGQGRANVTSCPAAWAEKALNECDGGIKLLTGGARVLATQQGVTRADFHDAAAAASAAYREFQQHLVDAVTPNTHDRYGVGAQPFDMLLRLGHCLDMDGAAVSAYAHKRLADARAGMAECAARIEPGAEPQTLLARLSELHPAVEDYYGTYQREWDAAKAFTVERELLTWPDYPISFEPIPNWARAAAPHLYFLFYRAPAPFDPHITQRYLVTPIDAGMEPAEQERRLRATNLSQIRLNHVIHHAGLGHHVQNWWAYRGPSRIGEMAAVDCALRIAMLSGGTMAEGWACYAVDLMAEQGYLTPLEELAEQQGLARMAGRAIVDAGLHSGDMSFDEAVAFYRDEVGMPPAASRSEAVKNSMFPGAAMMYVVGTDMIHDLREELRTRQGSDFSLARFHDDFLSHGAIPVALTAKLRRGEAIEMEGYVPAGTT
jgi:uncharacterized protein (DUF885 family)